jgi:signal transduction histidine kinase
MSLSNLRSADRSSGSARGGALAERPVPASALSLAAQRVVGAWSNERGEALSRDEARETMDQLLRLVETACAGDELSPGGPAASILGRRLLELLRAELLRSPVENASTPEITRLLTTLQAIEKVSRALEPDWSQYFSQRLSGPDGLDLVVEVAHDLRSPLTSILFLAETLQRGQSGEVNEVQRRQLGLIYSAALGLSSMASDVIELARGGDQLVEKEPSPFSITAILEAVRDMVRPIAEEKGLIVRLVPPASDRRLGRSLALSRVLLNLTTNALKFTDEGYVEIATQAKGLTHVEFSVRDTGRGISPEALENLYQPFRRTSARAGRSGYYFSGTGLGLAMCRKLVEAMGSKLTFETRSDWGTRFSFELNLPPVSHL